MEQYYVNSTKFSIQERQTKNHGKVYDIKFRIVTINGIEKQKKLSGYKTKTEAKAAYAKFVTERCTLSQKPTKRQKEENRLTVAALVPVYTAAMFHQSKESSIYDKRNIYRNIIIPTLGSEELQNLTTEKLYRWQDAIWSRKNPKTGNEYAYMYLSKIRMCLNSLLSFAESRYGIQNHLKEVKKPKRRQPKTEMKIWSKEMFEQFLEVVDEPIYKAFFATLFYTGRRKGEIIALQADDVNLENKKIKITKTYTRKTTDGTSYKLTSSKNEKNGVTSIPARLYEILLEYKPHATTPFYFSRNGGKSPMSENAIAYRFRQYTKQAELPLIRIHDLRHSYVSMLIHLGANFMVVADLIGDTVEQVTKTYAHLYETDKQNIIEKI